MNNNLSDYYLERFVLEELDHAHAEEISKRAAASTSLQTSLESIQSSNRDILVLYPPAMVRDSLMKHDIHREKKLKPHRFPFPFSLKRIIIFSSAFAAAALFFIVLLPSLKKDMPSISTPGQGEISLVKGPLAIDMSKTQLLIHRKKDSSVELLEDSSRAETGDLLQLGYVAAEKPYGVILSIDGRGSVSLHFPLEIMDSTKLELHSKSFLPNAIELDDAPEFERFFLITSDSPLDVNAVLKRAQKLAKDPQRRIQAEIDLPADIKQFTVLILKGEGQ